MFLERLEATRPYQQLRYWMNTGLVKFFSKNVFEGRTGLDVAEVACGSGAASHMIAGHPGIRISLAGDINMLDFQQARLKDFNAKFVLMDLFKPPLQPGSMDLVWNSSSVEEFDQPSAAVKGMAQLAKKGGYVFVGVPFKYGPAGWLGWIPNKKVRAWLGRNYSRKQLRALLEECGLIVEKELTYLGTTFIGALGRKPF
jgi:ubiquinone/menaquinone biosynthesis C-methylase UbiE